MLMIDTLWQAVWKAGKVSLDTSPAFSESHLIMQEGREAECDHTGYHSAWVLILPILRYAVCDGELFYIKKQWKKVTLFLCCQKQSITSLPTQNETFTCASADHFWQ